MMGWLTNLMLIFVFTMIISLISYFVFRVRGPWDSFWIKTLLLFLFLLAASLWIKPFGPEWYGVQWVVLFIGALLFILLLAAFSPRGGNDEKIPTHLSLTQQKRFFDEYKKQRKQALFSLGIMSWFLLVTLLVIIAVGYNLQ